MGSEDIPPRFPQRLREESSAIRAALSGRPAAWALFALALTLIAFLIVNLSDPTGWLGSDDAAYYSAAEFVLEGRPIQRLHHHYARMAMILPIAGALRLFGDTTFSVALPTLAASILGLVLIAVLGRILWSWWEGCLAAAIVAFTPYYRILSTSAFPDVHACFWTTTAVLLAVVAVRRYARGPLLDSTQGSWGAAFALVACGLAIGLAASAKMYSAPVLLPIALLILAADSSWRSRLAGAGCLALGLFLAFMADGLFFTWAAGDFFFNLHVHQQSAAELPLSNPDGSSSDSLIRLLWTRLCMPFDRNLSGWGSLGTFFWPVMLLTLFMKHKARFLVIWACATYLAVALMPLPGADGPRLNPLFHGRHVLPALIPFALCLASLTCIAVRKLISQRHTQWLFPAAMAIILLAAWHDRHDLHGFRDRQTRRLRHALSTIIRDTNWHPSHEIFMTASTYWRYRVLFPPPLRARLRVAVFEGAPPWWRHTTVDIQEKHQPLPSPDHACLIATPAQLQGVPEYWDYGVGLPTEALAAWQSASRIAAITRASDHTNPSSQSNNPQNEQFLLLLGNVPSSSQKVESSDDASDAVIPFSSALGTTVSPQHRPPSDR